ncbi:MAG: hypothetical protein JOY72_08140, partial [Actinobacteria bacterium]|nr:hypothetical protein [Actinomycetota bacterium]
PSIVDGTVSCEDSDPSTWSENQQSGGKGICIVYGIAAQPAGQAAAPTSTTTAAGAGTTPSSTPSGTGLFTVSSGITAELKVAKIPGFPKARELTVVNGSSKPITYMIVQFVKLEKSAYNPDGTINIAKAILGHTSEEITKLGIVGQDPVNGQKPLDWCYLSGGMVCKSTISNNFIIKPGESATLTILDYVGNGDVAQVTTNHAEAVGYVKLSG